MRWLWVCILLLGCVAETGIQPLPAKIYEGGELMKLTSSAFDQGEPIPKKYTCQGQDINPPLKWSDIPENTKSFALIVDDPDAQKVAGITWIHWLVKDIPASASSLSEDGVPGKEVINSFGRPGYGGPCPPSGTHRYFFKLSALDVVLELEAGADKGALLQAMEGHVLAEAELMGTYSR